MLSSIVLMWLVSLAISSPFPLSQQDANKSMVDIRFGKVIGSTEAGIENFRGIPYAQPPTGNLRLRPPQPIAKNFGIFRSQLTPNACPQFWAQLDGGGLAEEAAGFITNAALFRKTTLQSEDCLTLNVQRPAGTLPTARLPVVVWIFGGAFAIGATHLYDGSRIVQQSIDLELPLIFVAINYRLGGFGFLPGREVSAEGSSNLGLKDQRLALQWVQDNIAFFGGDPAKVTLWGESAGAISACDHTIINGGDISYKNGTLFRGGILNSGSVTPTVPVDHPKAQAIYDKVISAAGCSGLTDSLGCLRTLPYEQLSDAFATVPSFFGYSSVDLSYLPRPDPADGFLQESPEAAIQKSRFARIPIIIGDQHDEGTLFSLVQSNISTTDQLIDYLTPIFPLATRDIVAGLVDTYTQNASDTSALDDIYPQFKRLAAMLGDVTFTLQRRSYLASIASQAPVWSYIANYLPLTPVLGTFHASDVLSTFFNVPPVPTTESILKYYVSFINSLDPNAVPNSKSWPRYNAQDLQLLEFGALSHSILSDTFRQEAYKYLVKWQSILRI